ncbi:MAG: 23S rRNA (pseudouridine(1915)-N(3))-methyltransferase RlmH, partial [Clostridia bacterium]|nr:23S rRNA (pseudouridine(1915)-N(3))-methyltransferase RlmH [Clostridia bacterium]
MKKIELLCVGKIKEKYFTEGINEYIKRASKYAEVTVTEIPD